MRIYILSFAVLLALSASVWPQASAPSAEARKANELWQAQKWEEASVAYAALVKAEPANGLAWYRYGSALVSQNKYEESIATLEKAVEILNGPVVFYSLASAYAKLGLKDKAVDAVTKAAATGFSGYQRLVNDTNFAAMKSDPRFISALESVERNLRPCKYSPEARQLDFWVGEWELVGTNGQVLGTNVIQRLEEGCLIMENWTAASGGTGKSMNFYNPTLKKWRQTYMSTSQSIWEMTGEYKDNAMHFEGQVITPARTVMTRVVLRNQGPDRVHHTEDNSSDGGKTWTRVWDSIYRRKKPAAQ